MAVLLSGDSVLSRAGTRPWLWFNILSIDAPLVAIAWQVWFARCFQVTLSPVVVVTLALTVWMIYAADRLLDVRHSGNAELATDRHRFHREHAGSILVGVGLCFISLSLSAMMLSPMLLRDGLALSAVVLVYFLSVHLLPGVMAGLCPKEMAVGIVFALGTALAPCAQLQHSRELILPVSLFACLCFLNCSAIEVWEGSDVTKCYSSSTHFFTLWLVQHLRLLATLVAIAGVIALVVSRVHAVFAAIIVSALAFVWLDVERERLSPDLLRVLTDAALLSPVLLLPGLH